MSSPFVQSAKILPLRVGDRLAMGSWHADFFVGEWRVSPKLNNISKDGQTVVVKHKSMMVLTCLADANGEVVSRNDIMDDVWPGMTVTDDVLTQSIVELRKAFHDDARHPKVIETIPRVGVRLIATVAPAREDSPETATVAKTRVPGSARRYLIATIVLIVVGTTLWALLGRQEGPRQRVVTVEEPPSIAVLPFVNVSDDPDNEYFSDGLSEEILNLLGRIPGLKVIGRTSSFAFKGQNEDLRVIGQTLGVKTVLEGSVRKSGERVRISAQLVDASDGRQIWSESYDRTMTDIFAVQDNVAASIIDALEVHVAAKPTRGRPTEDAVAYSLFLKARASTNTYEFRDAEALLLKAVALDPNFAEAYEQLAIVYFFLAGTEVESAEGQQLMGEAAAKALTIDPNLVLAQALYQAGNIETFSWFGEFKALEQAVRAQPSNTNVLMPLSFDLIEAGYLREALAYVERMVELEPLWPNAHQRYFEILYAVGRKNEAIAALDVVKQLQPGLETWWFGVLHLVDGQDDIAIAQFEANAKRDGFADTSWVNDLVINGRDPANGQAYLDRRIPEIVASAPEEQAFKWELSLTTWYLHLGYLDRYFEILRDLDLTESTWTDADLLVYDGTLFWRHGFTAHPQYLKIADSIGMIDLWEQRGRPDFCDKVDGQWICE